MSNATSVYGLPYLEPTDPPDIAGGLQDLAEATETALTGGGRGVVGSAVVGTSADTGTTEVITNSVTFTASAGRAYRVSLGTPVLDNQGSAAQTAIVTLRWAPGATVNNSGTVIAKAVRNTPAVTGSTTAGSAAETASLTGWIRNPGAGQVTVGVGLAAQSGSSNIRFLAGSTIGPDLTPLLVVEDAGPAF